MVSESSIVGLRSGTEGTELRILLLLLFAVEVAS